MNVGVSKQVVILDVTDVETNDAELKEFAERLGRLFEEMFKAAMMGTVFSPHLPFDQGK